MLTRIAEEGWIARGHGYGWTFLPILASPEAMQQAYRFRIAIEPAALLEPAYEVDREAFARRRFEQEELVEGRIREISAAELFELGSRFHETVVGCSGNPFFLESLQRINRLRRLIDYRAGVKTGLFVDQAREHLEILDRLEGGHQVAAAELMRRHLATVSFMKFKLLGSGSEPQGPSGTRRRASGTAVPVAQAHF
jgi:DNA-binding GntR family transcriptional regulator